MLYSRTFNPKYWVRLLSKLDEPVSASERVQFLLYMRRNLSRPRQRPSKKLVNMWARKEGMETKRVCPKR